MYYSFSYFLSRLMNETLVAKLLVRGYFFSQDVKIFENWVDDGVHASIHCDVTGQITSKILFSSVKRSCDLFNQRRTVIPQKQLLMTNDNGQFVNICFGTWRPFDLIFTCVFRDIVAIWCLFSNVSSPISVGEFSSLVETLVFVWFQCCPSVTCIQACFR